MNSIEYVKKIYFKKPKENKFSMNENGSLNEVADTKDRIEYSMYIKFPIYGKQFLDNNERKFDIFFDTDKPYNTSICSYVDTEDNCEDFIINQTIKKFWSDVIIPESIVPEDYYTNFWNYNIKIHIGNAVFYKEQNKNIAVLPYYVEFNK